MYVIIGSPQISIPTSTNLHWLDRVSVRVQCPNINYLSLWTGLEARE